MQDVERLTNLTFQLVPSKYKTLRYDVLSARTGERLGAIQWYSRWRRYVFVPPSTVEKSFVYDSACLMEICNVIWRMMEERDHERPIREC